MPACPVLGTNNVTCNRARSELALGEHGDAAKGRSEDLGKLVGCQARSGVGAVGPRLSYGRASFVSASRRSPMRGGGMRSALSYGL